MFQGKLRTIGGDGWTWFSQALVLALVALAALAMVWLVWPALAVAQEAGAAAAADPGTAINLGDLFGDARSTLYTIVSVVVMGAIGWAVRLLQRSTGISIDAKMRDSLHSAVMNGVNYGLDAVQHRADATTIDVKSKIVAEGIQYVRSYAPKAAAHFKLTDADIGVMLRAKLVEAKPAETKPAPQAAGA